MSTTLPDIIAIRLSGFKELAQQLHDLPEKIARQELDRSLREAAMPMLRAAQANAPVMAQSTTQRRSGTLRKNIRIKIFRVRGSLNRGISIGVRKLSKRQIRANAIAAKISRRRLGVNLSRYWDDPFFWYFVEHGTKKMVAHNFLGRAFDSHHEQFLNRFKLILGGRIETIWNQNAR